MIRYGNWSAENDYDTAASSFAFAGVLLMELRSFGRGLGLGNPVAALAICILCSSSLPSFILYVIEGF